MLGRMDVLLGLSMVAVVLYCVARAFVPALPTPATVATSTPGTW